MEKNRNIKYVVKVIYITKPLQKIHFTVRHPENACYLSGIKVSTNNILGEILKVGQIQNDVTGFLSLAIPQEGDVFYTEEVFSEIPDYAAIVLKELSAMELGGKTPRKKNDYFNTCVQINEAIMEGYYEDTAFSMVLSPVKPKGEFDIRKINPYKITLYLRYQLKEEKQL